MIGFGAWADANLAINGVGAGYYAVDGFSPAYTEMDGTANGWSGGNVSDGLEGGHQQ